MKSKRLVTAAPCYRAADVSLVCDNTVLHCNDQVASSFITWNIDLKRFRAVLIFSTLFENKKLSIDSIKIKNIRKFQQNTLEQGMGLQQFLLCVKFMT